MVACHYCDNPSCVNPFHIWIGTQSENIQDSADKNRHFCKIKTHCKYGHEFTVKNTFISNDKKYRVCITCKKEAGIRTKNKNREYNKIRDREYYKKNRVEILRKAKERADARKLDNQENQRSSKEI